VPLLLARIDDRLIHGQVAYGWALPLRATWIAIVSDSLRARPSDAELYLLAAPEGVKATVASVEEASEPGFRDRVESVPTLLLFPGPEEPLRLAEAGFPLPEVNVGGLHYAAGRREWLPYVYLDDADADRLRSLAARGVRVLARDLPDHPEHDLGEMLLEANRHGDKR
jgi:mannose/fructose/N-acetylgalactosamine-specific phosphotransferase system component IIB